MCHKWSQKIPHIHESSLPIVYKDYSSNFKKVLITYRSVLIHTSRHMTLFEGLKDGNVV